jgi:ABC-2 type transport system permease protein
VTSAAAPHPSTGWFGGFGDIKQIFRQTRYEQLAFWLNPIGAFFTIGFSTIFLLIMESSSGHQHIASLGSIKAQQYYVPAFLAYGVMSACYNIQAIVIVNRRETGLLKRLRLSPAPTWILMSSILLSSMIIAAISVLITIVVGRFGYSVHGPVHVLPFIIVIAVGMFAFTSLAMGVSTLIPNADSAGPVSSIVFFILLAFSGLWFNVPPNSGIGKVTTYFPVLHLITALEKSFNAIPGVSPWAWSDIYVIALWGVGGAILALRRWEWSPRRG